MTLHDFLANLSWSAAGGVVVAITNFFNNKRLTKIREREVNTSDKRTEADIKKELYETDLRSFEILRETWQEEFSRMREEMNGLLVKIDKLERRCETLEVENMRLKQELNSLH